MRKYRSHLTVSCPRYSSLCWKPPSRRSASFTSPTPPRAVSLSTFDTRHLPCYPCAICYARPFCAMAHSSMALTAPSSCPPSTCCISTAATVATSTGYRPRHPPTTAGQPSSTSGSSGARCLRALRGSVQARTLAAYGGRHLRRCACVCQRCKASRTCCPW